VGKITLIQGVCIFTPEGKCSLLAHKCYFRRWMYWM